MIYVILDQLKETFPMSDENIQILKTDNSTEYKISSNARMFRVLSSGLYSDKIRAVIRELSTNAYDAQTLNGNENIPFEVHLPTPSQNFFSVRDFGPGLTHEQAMDLYTTYGESTKIDDNKQIGCLGLGSKSPFAYTDSFFVISRNNGKKRVYLSTFFASAQTPTFDFVKEEDCNEPSGLEVKFTVPHNDISYWPNKAAYVYSFFKVKPKLVDSTSREALRTIVDSYKDELAPGIYLNPHNSSTLIVQGNISYPLIEAHNFLGNIPVIIEFPIGSLGFAVSRESLEYTPATIGAINTRLKEVETILNGLYEDEWLSLKTTYEKIQFLIATPRYFARALEFICKKYDYDPAIRLRNAGYVIQYPYNSFGVGKFYDLNHRKLREMMSFNYTRTKELIIVYQDIKTFKVNKLREYYRDVFKPNPNSILLIIASADKNPDEGLLGATQFVEQNSLDGYPYKLVPYSSLTHHFPSKPRAIVTPSTKADGYRVYWHKDRAYKEEFTDNMLYVIASPDPVTQVKTFLLGKLKLHWPPTIATMNTIRRGDLQHVAGSLPLFIVDEKNRKKLPATAKDFNEHVRDFLAVNNQLPDLTANIEKRAAEALKTKTFGLCKESVRNRVASELPGSVLHQVLSRYEFGQLPHVTWINYNSLRSLYDMPELEIPDENVIALTRATADAESILSSYPILRALTKDKSSYYYELSDDVWFELIKLLKK